MHGEEWISFTNILKPNFLLAATSAGMRFMFLFSVFNILLPSNTHLPSYKMLISNTRVPCVALFFESMNQNCFLFLLKTMTGQVPRLLELKDDDSGRTVWTPCNTSNHGAKQARCPKTRSAKSLLSYRAIHVLSLEINVFYALQLIWLKYLKLCFW